MAWIHVKICTLIRSTIPLDLYSNEFNNMNSRSDDPTTTSVLSGARSPQEETEKNMKRSLPVQLILLICLLQPYLLVARSTCLAYDDIVDPSVLDLDYELYSGTWYTASTNEPTEPPIWYASSVYFLIPITTSLTQINRSYHE